MHFSFTDIFPDINRLLRIAYNYLQRARKKYSFELKACQRIFTHHHDNGKTVRLGYDEHSLRKPIDLLRCCGSAFCGKIQKNASY